MLGLLKKYWWKIFIVIFFVFIIPVFIERVLFALGKWIPLTTVFSPDQILNYVVAIMVLIATVILGFIVWKQNQSMHKINSNLQQKNMELAEQSIKQNEMINEINLALQKQNIEIAEKNMLYATYNYSSIKHIAFQVCNERVVTLNKENNVLECLMIMMKYKQCLINWVYQ